MACIVCVGTKPGLPQVHTRPLSPVRPPGAFIEAQAINSFGINKTFTSNVLLRSEDEFLTMNHLLNTATEMRSQYFSLMDGLKNEFTASLAQ